MDQWKSESNIYNPVDNYRDSTRILEKDVDSFNSNPKDEPARGVNLESNSGQASKGVTEGVDLETNRVFVG